MEEGKHNRKSIVRNIIFKKEGQGAKGAWFLFEITFDNGDSGQYFAKSNPQTEFKEGESIEYIIEKKINGQFTNTNITLPYKGKGGGKTFSPIHANKQCSLTNAVNLCISGKIEKEDIYKTADNFLKHLMKEI